MSIIYRPVEYKDFLKIAEVRTNATEEIKRRHGFGSKKTHNEPNPFYVFFFAEGAGRVLGG
jgi:hypothetical protein